MDAGHVVLGAAVIILLAALTTAGWRRRRSRFIRWTFEYHAKGEDRTPFSEKDDDE